MACNPIEKVGRKDLKGPTKVYANKLVRLPSTEYYIEKVDASSQTKILPQYMQPLERKKNWPALK